LNSLWAIHEYIAQSSPEYALQIVDRLTRCAWQLKAHPLSGRKVPESDLPQVCELIEGSCRIIYRLTP